MLWDPSVPDAGEYVPLQLLAVELTPLSEQVANIEEGESRERLTEPEGAVEPDPDWRSLIVAVHESLVPITIEDETQLMKLAVAWTFTVKVKVPEAPEL